MDATKLVTGEMLGMNGKRIVIAGKSYVIQPPSIKKLCGAAYYLTDCEDADTLKGVLLSISNLDNTCKALSWLVNGDEELTEEFKEGTLDEIVEGICVGLDMLSVENFIRLSSSVRSVRTLTAKQKQ